MEDNFYLDTFLSLLRGVPLTLELAVLSIVVGMMLAVVLATLQVYGASPLRGAVAFYVFLFRGTPLLAQLFLIYYGIAQFQTVRESFLWVYLRDPFWCSVLAMTLNTAAYGCKIVQGGILSVPVGQIEAARACGMSPLKVMSRVVVPLAIRQALPAYGNEFILMVKSTSLASVVTLMEITGIAHKIISDTYRAIDVFICAGAIYLFLNFVITRVVNWLERRLTPYRRPSKVSMSGPVSEVGVADEAH
ncbi:ABC transporter permease [Paraburkholderia sp. J8-2]|uniref:ABC transporter permease n=1 Tax=Paraburkholderia sp. J8-2 TaxID=2805440 RepID=UPI002AB7BA67|nr:ABC transporter permease [Paraburkholderia sp. J8-2]